MCVRAGTPLYASTHVHLRVGCLPPCCLIAILSAANQCATHCRNGLSNFPVSGQPRYNGFSVKCLSCQKHTVRQPGRLNADRQTRVVSLASCDQAASNYSGEIIRHDETVCQPSALKSSGQEQNRVGQHRKQWSFTSVKILVCVYRQLGLQFSSSGF